MATEDQPIDRVRTALQAVSDEDLRTGLRLLPPAVLQKVADDARTKTPVLLRGKPSKFLDRLTDTTLVLAVADAVTADALEETADLLGDDWDDPSREQLVKVVDVLTERHPGPVVATMLAAVVTSQANAAEIAEELLDSDPRLALTPPADTDDDAPAVVAPAPVVQKQATPEQREARKARKEAEKERKRKEAGQAAKVNAARKAARKRPAPPTAVEEEVEERPVEERPRLVRPATPPIQGRRKPQYTEDEAHHFFEDDPLIGSVVIAEIGFDSEDAEHPDGGRKARPCVVVGVSAFELLVRPAYSDGGSKSRSWKSHQLRDWGAAGLDGPSWVEDEARRVPKNEAGESIGRLSDRDWNALW